MKIGAELEHAGFERTPAGDGLVLWMRGLRFPPAQYEVLRHLQAPDSQRVEVLKLGPRRSVFRVRGFSPELSSVVVKGFPLTKLESRLKYRKYGVAEWRNYLLAAERGIPTPTCYGYFEVRQFGLVKANGTVIEDLAGWISLERLWRENSGSLETLARGIPMLRQLFNTGVNHIDPSPHNLLFHPTEARWRLIDWQYCASVPPRQTAQLVLQATHFLRYAEVTPGSPGWEPWLGQLYAACEPGCGFTAFTRATARLQAAPRLPSATRLGLTLDVETLAILANG